MNNMELWIRDLHKLVLELYGFRIVYLENESNNLLIVVSKDERTSCGFIKLKSPIGDYPILLGEHEKQHLS